MLFFLVDGVCIPSNPSKYKFFQFLRIPELTISFFVGLRCDAHVVVERELVAVQHRRPREPVRLHCPLAAGLHLLTQRAARVDRPLQADRSKKGTEEELAISVTLHVEKRNPRCSLEQIITPIVH